MDKWINVHRNANISQTVDWILKNHPWSGSRNFSQVFKIYGINRESHILDAGCSTGKIGLATALKIGCKLTCLDYYEEGLRLANEVYKELKDRIDKAPEVEFIQGDIQNLGYKDQFDIVFNEGVIEHWQDKKDRLNAIYQMAKSTKPGGKVLIWVPNKKNPFYRFYRRLRYNPKVSEWLFTSEELVELMLEAGLKNIEVKGFQAYLSPFYLSPKFISRLKPLAVLFWLIGEILPLKIKGALSLRFSFEILGIGEKS
jgi:SAM-dependent methyltransferase